MYRLAIGSQEVAYDWSGLDVIAVDESLRRVLGVGGLSGLVRHASETETETRLTGLTIICAKIRIYMDFDLVLGAPIGSPKSGSKSIYFQFFP